MIKVRFYLARIWHERSAATGFAAVVNLAPQQIFLDMETSETLRGASARSINPAAQPTLGSNRPPEGVAGSNEGPCWPNMCANHPVRRP